MTYIKSVNNGYSRHLSIGDGMHMYTLYEDVIKSYENLSEIDDRLIESLKEQANNQQKEISRLNLLVNELKEDLLLYEELFERGGMK